MLKVTDQQVSDVLGKGAGLLDYFHEGGVYVPPLIFGEGVIVIRSDGMAFMVPAEDVHMEADELFASLIGSIRRPARVIGRAVEVMAQTM